MSLKDIVSYPWSVIGYFNNECIPRAFWQSTGSNDIIGEVLSNATVEKRERTAHKNSWTSLRNLR